MKQLASVAMLIALFSMELQLSFGALTMDEIRSGQKILRNHCQPKFGLSDDVIDATMKGQFADDKNLKCYMSCMMHLSHSLRDGKYQADMALEMVEDLLPPEIKDKVKNVIQKCRNAADGIDDECEIAFTLSKCAYEADSELYNFP